MEPHAANDQMVDRLIAEGGLWSAALIRAFRATPRHSFVDRVFVFHRKNNRWREIITRNPGPRELAIVYSDRALTTHLSNPEPRRPETQVPISSSSQPSLMAQMLEDLHLRAGLRTLEVGAGTGYNAALLAHVVGPGQVTSVDIDRNVLSEAWDHLRAFPERHVELRQAEGREGFPDKAPFDRIMVTAATPDLEPAWLDQLAQGGILLAPLALAPGLAYVTRGRVTGGCFRGQLTRPAYFMALRGEGESGVGEDEGSLPVGALSSQPAPWAGWFHRRSGRYGWFGLLQALAFFGYLAGLDVHYRTDNGVFFGISEPARDGVCWFGEEEWQFSDTGADVGRALWQAFLEAGGPRPTEFQLWAGPAENQPAAQGPVYCRRGPRWLHRWELPESRDRPTWA
jgi:protein-L-isoaspartate(D-aspartate) O-methyltransferase